MTRCKVPFLCVCVSTYINMKEKPWDFIRAVIWKWYCSQSAGQDLAQRGGFTICRYKMAASLHGPQRASSHIMYAECWIPSAWPMGVNNLWERCIFLPLETVNVPFWNNHVNSPYVQNVHTDNSVVTSLKYQFKLFAHSNHRSADETIWTVHFYKLVSSGCYFLFFYCCTMKKPRCVFSFSKYTRVWVPSESVIYYSKECVVICINIVKLNETITANDDKSRYTKIMVLI